MVHLEIVNNMYEVNKFIKTLAKGAKVITVSTVNGKEYIRYKLKSSLPFTYSK